MIKTFKHFVIILGLLAAQFSLVPILPGVFREVDVVLTGIIFLCIAYEFYLGVIYAVIFGLVLDLYSSLPFGAALISLLVTLFVVYEVSKHLLTNKSYYALLGLSLLSTIIHGIIINLYQLAKYFIQSKDVYLAKQLWLFSAANLFWQLLLNACLISIVFIIFHATSRRFKAVFIDTTKR